MRFIDPTKVMDSLPLSTLNLVSTQRQTFSTCPSLYKSTNQLHCVPSPAKPPRISYLVNEAVADDADFVDLRGNPRRVLISVGSML